MNSNQMPLPNIMAFRQSAREGIKVAARNGMPVHAYIPMAVLKSGISSHMIFIEHEADADCI